MSESIRILLLDDGIPGHGNQARAICALLGERVELDIHELSIRMRLRALARPVLKRYINRSEAPLSLLTSLFFGRELIEQATEFQPQLVLSAGGNTAYFNILLSRQLRCPNWFIGSLRKLQPAHFHRVFLLEDIQSGNNIVLPLPISRMLPSAPPGQDDCWAMLIGGNGAGSHYRDEDWQALADNMKAVSETRGIRWQLSTSRRTPEIAEEVLRDTLPAGSIAHAVWYQRGERGSPQELLDNSVRAFCTADSMAMIGDCLHSARPTTAIHCRQFQPDERFAAALRRFKATDWLEISPISEFAAHLDSHKGKLSEIEERQRALQQLEDELAGTIITSLNIHS